MADYNMSVDSLSRALTELQIMGTTRCSRNTSMPMTETAHRFDMMARKMTKCNKHEHNDRNRELLSFFGIPPLVIAKVWELLHKHEVITKKVKHKHLLWALHYLKEYPGVRPMCSTIYMPEEEASKPDDKTLTKWTWTVIEAISDLQDEVILWENRKKSDRGTDCLIGVDCKDCKFQQILCDDPSKPGKKMVNKSLYSKKFHGPALRYEIATSLLSNDIVWLAGPYLPGDFNDIEIFRHSGLKAKLEESGERAEADDGYIGEAPEFIICPKSVDCVADEDKRAFNRRAQGRIESLNKHLTFWKCMDNRKFLAKGTPEERVEKHRMMFTACVVLKQIGMDLGYGELYKMGDDYY